MPAGMGAGAGAGAGPGPGPGAPASSIHQLAASGAAAPLTAAAPCSASKVRPCTWWATSRARRTASELVDRPHMPAMVFKLGYEPGEFAAMRGLADQCRVGFSSRP